MTQNELLKKQLQEMKRKAGRSIVAAKRHMEDGDYEFGVSIEQEEAREDILSAESMVWRLLKTI